MFAYVHWRSREYLRSPCLTCDFREIELNIWQKCKVKFQFYTLNLAYGGDGVE